MLDDVEIWSLDDQWPQDEAGATLAAWRAPPEFRRRLHAICALYAHARPEQRGAILDHLESLALEAAATLAENLLDGGWRPSPQQSQPPIRAGTAAAGPRSPPSAPSGSRPAG